MYYAEIFPGKRGRVFYWHFVQSTNGKTTADSEEFPSKAHAKRAVKAVVKGVGKGLGKCTFEETPLADDVVELRWTWNAGA